VISKTISIEPVAFTSMDAFSILSRLGFDVKSDGEEGKVGKFVMIKQREEGNTKGRGIIIPKDNLKSLWSFKGGVWKKND